MRTPPTLVTSVFGADLPGTPAAAGIDTQGLTAFLAIDLPMAVYADAASESLVRRLRGERPTRIHVLEPADLARQALYAPLATIRSDPSWPGHARGHPEGDCGVVGSAVALSKPLWLYQQALVNPFGSSHLYWSDAGLARGLPPGVWCAVALTRLARRHRRFLLVCTPSDASRSLQGFDAAALARLAGVDRVRWTAQGGFFGGGVAAIQAQVPRYAEHLERTLGQGLLGDASSLLTLQSYADAEHCDLQFTCGDGALQPFFEQLARGWPGDVRAARELLAELAETWIVSFHAPQQLERLLASLEASEPALLHTGRRVLVDNSNRAEFFPAYDALCARYGLECLREGNRGMDGARMRAAELFLQGGRHAMFWFEDDMLLVPQTPSRTCENGFPRHVHALASSTLAILQREFADHVKLNFTEVHRAHLRQDVWQHLERPVREHYFPDDAEPPPQAVAAIQAVGHVPYALGEAAYSNWPHLITRRGTQAVFIEERADPCREQYWAARAFEMLRQGRLRAAVLLASPVEHLRTQDYPSVERVHYQVVDNKPLVAPVVEAPPVASRRSWPHKPGTIFVSIANYRDSETPHTLRDLYARAKHPERVFAGVFSQVVPGDDDDCLADARPHGAPPGHVRELRMHAADSLGACWARSRILEELLQGEQYVLQIDSHSRFETGWDEVLLHMLGRCGSDRAVLSAYPPSYELPDTRHPSPPGVIAANVWDPSGILILKSRLFDPDHLPSTPVPAAFIAAGCLFGPAAAFREVPYDPYLYFHGEEVSLSVRLWTHGWNVFAPDRTVLYHDYSATRGRRRNWDDRRDWVALNQRSFGRLRHLLGIEESRDPAVLREIDRYGLGAVRSLAEFEEFADVGFARRRIGPRARDGRFPEPAPASTVAMLRAARGRYVDERPHDEEDKLPPRESRSGPDSTLQATAQLRTQLGRWLRENEVRSLVDAGCGDFNWLQAVDFSGIALYAGYDIVPELIARNQHLYGQRRGHFFAVADIARAQLPAFDAILCRHVLDEMPQEQALLALANIRASGVRWLLASTRTLLADPSRYRDLLNPPFGLPIPTRLLPDAGGSMLGIWRLAPAG